MANFNTRKYKTHAENEFKRLYGNKKISRTRLDREHPKLGRHLRKHELIDELCPLQNKRLTTEDIKLKITKRYPNGILRSELISLHTNWYHRLKAENLLDEVCKKPEKLLYSILKKKRQDKIRELIINNPYLMQTELASMFRVSVKTIQRDFKEIGIISNYQEPMIHFEFEEVGRLIFLGSEMNKHPKMSLDDLAKEYSVSKSTILEDIKKLERLKCKKN